MTKIVIKKHDLLANSSYKILIIMKEHFENEQGRIRLPYAVRILCKSFEPWFGAFLLLEIKGLKSGLKEYWLFSENQSSSRKTEKPLLKQLSSNIYTYRPRFESHATSVRDVEPSYVKRSFNI